MRTHLSLVMLSEARVSQAKTLKTKEDRFIWTGITLSFAAVNWADNLWAGVQVPCDVAYDLIERYATARWFPGTGLDASLMPSWREWVDEALKFNEVSKVRVLGGDGKKIRVFRRAAFDTSKIFRPRLDTDADLEALRWPPLNDPVWNTIFAAEGTDRGQCETSPQAS